MVDGSKLLHESGSGEPNATDTFGWLFLYEEALGDSQDIQALFRKVTGDASIDESGMSVDRADESEFGDRDLSSVAVDPNAYEIAQEHSTASFRVRHIFTTLTGYFRDFSGIITYDPDAPGEASVEIAVQAASIDTDNERRDGHLKSEDFFAVEKFPKLTFRSKKVSGSGGDLQVTGDLTIRGVTKEVTVPVEVLGIGSGKAGFAAEFTIKRLDYGVSWNRAMEGGGTLLDDVVTIRIDIEADSVKAIADLL